MLCQKPEARNPDITKIFTNKFQIFHRPVAKAKLSAKIGIYGLIGNV
jgi:hypothetical protein